MDDFTPKPEKVLKGLLDCLGGRARALTVGIDRSRRGAPGYAITPFGLVLGDTTYRQMSDSLAHAGSEPPLVATAAHALGHLRHSTLFNDVGKLKDLSIALISILEDERVERRIGAELPGVRGVLARQFDPEYASALIGVEGALARIACALNRRENLFDDLLCEKALLALDRLEEPGVTFDDVRAAGSPIANDLGQLRYRFDRSRYEVWPPYRDDNSVLWSDKRAEDQVHEAVSTQREPPNRPPPPDETVQERKFIYDEWDHAQAHYLPGHVVVHESVSRRVDQAQGRIRFSPAVSQQSRRSERHRRGRRRYFSEAGDAVDLDRAIARSVDLACGIPPDERVHEVRLRFRTRFGVLLLLDASESANDRIPGTYSTVLDHERRALRHLATLLAGEATPFGVYSFQSDTREHVTVRMHKGLADRWGPAIAEDIHAIRAHKSTRMGAAIRHMATAAGRLTERTLLIVLTDGEPSDVDASDPDYLVEDARRATEELRTLGFAVLCLKIGSAGRKACERIFGRAGVVHSEADRLQASLVTLVRSIRTESE
ncbi:MAG: VWA domain-containing protein [Burkholderiaceae bacterium]|nr:VWA domain-containing protein [Burkholderiaceae bacterium]